MANEFERAVVVDPEGFFVAALQWEKGTPAPDLQTRLTKGSAPKLIMLRDPYAIEHVNPAYRWDFTPVREQPDPDGPTQFVRAGTWQKPPARRWIVSQRRDYPDLWFLTGERMIWPERAPRLSEGAKFVDVEPPKSSTNKPIWHDARGEWVLPRRFLVCDADGCVLNTVLSYVDEDRPELPDGGYFVEEVEPLTGIDSRGEEVPVAQGDIVHPDGSVEIRAAPQYREVPVEHLIRAMEAAKVFDAFVDFLRDKGISVDAFRGLGNASIGTGIVRAFLDQLDGLSAAEAYQQIQLRAEEGHDAELATLAAMRG